MSWTNYRKVQVIHVAWARTAVNHCICGAVVIDIYTVSGTGPLLQVLKEPEVSEHDSR